MIAVRKARARNLFTVTEAVAYAGNEYTGRAIRYWIENGVLPAMEVSSGYLIDKRDLDAILKEKRGARQQATALHSTA